MLLYFGSFKVPGVPGVTVYLDHEKTNKFYCVREVPKLSMDAASGEPMLYYTSIRRDARITESDTVNLGFMTLTVDLGVTKEEEEKIREYIYRNYNNTVKETFEMLKRLNIDQKNHPTPTPRLISKSEIEIGTISWKDGTAQLELMEGVGGDATTFKTYGTGTTIPSLYGYCHASFSESFGSEGDLLMRSLLNMDGGDAKRAINMGAVVRYVLNGFAYIPSMQVKIHIDTKKVYDYWNRDRDVTAEENKGSVSIWNDVKGGRDKSLSVSGYHDIEIATREIHNTISGAIDVVIEDYSGMVSDKSSEWANQIVNAYISAITEAIIPHLFTEVKDPEVLDQLNRDKDDDKESNTDSDKKLYKYYYLSEDKIDTTDIYLNFTKSCVMPLTIAPQGTLMINGLTPEQKKNLCREVDIADDTFQGLSVPVEVSANFQEDNIYSVEVDVLYQHMNAVTGKERVVSNTYKFKTGDETYMFRATKAKDEKGKYYDDYKVRSRILFKNQNEYFGGGDGWSDWQTLSEKVLTVSYGKIGFLRTEVSPVNFDSDVIKEAIVHFKYLGANQSDTQGDVRLTPDGGTKSWKCFKYRSASDKYQYSVKYFYNDGTVFETDSVTTNADSITIEDPFVKPISADFYVKMGNNISNVKVEVSFTDGKYEKRSNHSFTAADAMDPWHWAIKVRKEAKETMKYRYIAFYNSDTDPYTSQWISASAKNETIYIKAESDPNAKPEAVKQESQLTIDSTMLSWEKWKRVYVILKDDSGKTRTLPLNADEPITTVDVTYSSDGMNACQCSCQFLPQQGAVIKTPTVECQDVFIIEEPQS